MSVTGKHDYLAGKNVSVLDKSYWKEAARGFSNVRILAFAALIVALRVAVKLIKIPIAAGLNITFDCYVNALGSFVYGPVMALAVGAVSDTLGAIIAPSGPYFFPFIFTEMLSGFIFGLFFWRRTPTVGKTLASKFTVNFVCNIILTSVLMKWYYYVLYGVEKAEAYAIINLVRIVKNLVMFPIEAFLIVIVLNAALPVLRSQRIISSDAKTMKMEKKHYWIIGALLVLSVLLILFYIFFLKDYVSAHNFKWL